MNKRLLFQWIPLVCIILLVSAGYYLKKKNDLLGKKNNLLILQNDSILSVNILLEKNLLRQKEHCDSLLGTARK